MQHRLRDRADEINVVADENQRALVLRERADQRVDAADIEMRRRLVHQQQIRRIEQQLDQREPRLFSAAQHAVVLENVVAAKKKRAEHRARRLFGDRVRHVARGFQHRLLRIEHLDPILRKIADLHIVAESRARRSAREARRREV